MLYPTASRASQKVFEILQADLSRAGIMVQGVATPGAAYFAKYLGDPSVAKAGEWDLALGGWGPDWYGDAAVSFFKQLFSGPSSYPPAGSNYGFYDNPAVTSLINNAADQASASTAARMWAQADQK